VLKVFKVFKKEQRQRLAGRRRRPLSSLQARSAWACLDDKRPLA
jgi:hypothetical protein